MKILFATPEDYSAMREIYAPYVEKTTISFEYEAPSYEEFSARMTEIGKTYPVLVAKENDEVVGYAYGAKVFERRAYVWSCELSVYIREDKRGMGYGKALVGALESLLKSLGYRKIYSLVTEENEPSLRFHASMGYTMVASFPEQGYKFNKWLAVVWLEKELGGREVSKNEPKTVTTLSMDEIKTARIGEEW